MSRRAKEAYTRPGASAVSRQMILDAERAVAARRIALILGPTGTPSHRDVAAVEQSRVEADRYRQLAADVGGHYGVSRAADGEATRP